MEDKLTNLMIAIILVIVIALAGVFAYKLTQSKIQTATKPNYQTENYIQKNESVSITKTEDNKNQEQTSSTSIVIPLSESDKQKTSTQTQIQTQTTTAAVETYVYNNRFYYNQLNTYEKNIYDAIVKNMDKLKTGNTVIKIDSDISKLMSEKGGDEKLKIYYGDAVNALNLDVPDLFFLDLSKFCLRIESTTSILGTKYQLYIDSGINANYFVDGFETQIQVEQAIESIETIKEDVLANTTGNQHTNVKLIHDWIIDNLNYNSSAKYKNSIYGALLEKEAVCEGYARTYKYFLDSLGIENILVVGVATNPSGQTEDHMWNYVKMNDNWYVVDTTWDDPIVHGGGTIGYDIKHRYFLIGSSDLSSHTVRNKISPGGQEFTLPILSLNNY